MAKNDPNNPDAARTAQDVDVPPQRLNEGPQHSGRGGAGNVDKPSFEEQESHRLHNQRLEEEARQKQAHEKNIKGLADKGKELLFGHKSGQKS